MFAKLLIEVLCLGKDSPDAHRLLNYKAPKTAKAVRNFLLKNVNVYIVDAHYGNTSIFNQPRLLQLKL